MCVMVAVLPCVWWCNPKLWNFPNKKSRAQIHCIGGVILKGFPSPGWLEMKQHWGDIAASHITSSSRARLGVHPALPNLIPSLQGRDNTTDMRSLVQFSSVAQSCLTLCDPMNCSTPGLPVHHQIPEFTQSHVHRVGDAIQPSHPLLAPSLPALNLPQHQGLFWWVGFLHRVDRVLELQHQSLWQMFRADFL